MKSASKKHSYFYRNGLTIVFLTLFIATLAIYLRQKGSPESKSVDAPDLETGK